MRRYRRNLLLAMGCVLGLVGLTMTSTPVLAADQTTECMPCTNSVTGGQATHDFANQCCQSGPDCYRAPLVEAGTSGNMYNCQTAHNLCGGS